MTAQQEFEIYNSTHLEWDLLSEENKLNEMKEYTRLKRLAMKEQQEQEAFNQLQEINFKNEQKANFIQMLKDNDFKADGSKEDFIKLFDDPAKFGEHREKRALLEFEKDGDKLQNFIQLFLQNGV